ncbi:MAG: sugar transferase [Candidatus Omnitrophota bacterium]
MSGLNKTDQRDCSRERDAGVDDMTGYYALKRKFRLKYAVDRCMAPIVLVLCLPVVLLAAFLIKLDGWIHPENAGSVFYTEPRMSAGRMFNIVKFRTVPESVVKAIKETPEKASITGCREKTRAGEIILRWYLDELPQIINILKGEMSFVGPRPHVIAQSRDDVEKNGLIHREYIKAGLLGIIQAMKRDIGYHEMFSNMESSGLSRPEIQKKKYTFYADECLKKSPLGIVFFDLCIIARGLITVAKGEKVKKSV